MSVIRNSRLSTIQELRIEVNGRAVGTSRIVCYIVGVRYSGVSVKRGSTVQCFCIDLAKFEYWVLWVLQ